MKIVNPFKNKLATGLIVIVLALATPIIAGVTLNTFQPGETISSTAVNENFSNLQDQVNNICNQQGQLVLAAVIGQFGDIEPPFFSCNDAAVTSSMPSTGRYDISIDGLNPDDMIIQVTPRSGMPRYCIIGLKPDVFEVACFNEMGTPSNAVFYLIAFRR